MSRRLFNVKRIMYIIFTIIIIVVSTGLISIKAYSMEKDSQEKAMKAYCLSIEKQYIKDTRERLNELGYYNAGVMLLSHHDNEGNKVYTLTINHRKLEGLTPEELMEKMDLYELPLGTVNCVMTSL